MPSVLRRELGLGGAVLLGLGSIVGTGVFVSLAVAAGVAGSGVIVATVLAGLLAACNALSSAQLAAEHPVAGGTYVYGRRHFSPLVGFLAGWLFLLAKSASAATAGLGLAGYVLYASGGGQGWATFGAILAIVLATGVALVSVKRGNVANAVIVGVVLLALGVFVVACLASDGFDGANLSGLFDVGPIGLLHGTALMFVAYTGYGRIATMGEEVAEPRRTIPRAIVVTLVVSGGLYVLVAAAAVSVVGADVLAETVDGRAAPLERIAAALQFGGDAQGWLKWVVLIGAVAAMAGVLYNLVLGLSRVLLAMGRTGDMPQRLGRLNAGGTVPTAAVLTIGVLIAALAALGDVRLTWSFSAFTVLAYYALTNACALRLPVEHRLYPRWISWLGLLGCAGLAWWVEWQIWTAGLAVLAAGVAWFALARRLDRGESSV
jgi:APA family basic amino acid/polyamine antiporter